jgi:hypothetical protein
MTPQNRLDQLLAIVDVPTNRHYIFATYHEAMEAWSSLTIEQQERIAGPRQAIPNVWIFDIPHEENDEWQS